MDETLKEIKNAESKANSIIDSAAKNKATVIEHAEEEARRAGVDEMARLSRQMEERYEFESQAIKKEAQAVIEDAKRGASRISKRADANAGRAEAHLLKKLGEMVE